jgi:hypothetical protein
MLASLVLAALIAQPSAAHLPTATVEVSTMPELPPPPARTRLGLDRTVGLGRFASALAASFARWSLDVGVPTLARPAPLSDVASTDGLLVAHLGQGLFLGHSALPCPQRLTRRDCLAATPTLLPAGPQVGLDATLFVTPVLGVRFEANAGAAQYGGLSLIVRFGK